MLPTISHVANIYGVASNFISIAILAWCGCIPACQQLVINSPPWYDISRRNLLLITCINHLVFFKFHIYYFIDCSTLRVITLLFIAMGLLFHSPFLNFNIDDFLLLHSVLHLFHMCPLSRMLKSCFHQVKCSARKKSFSKANQIQSSVSEEKFNWTG